MPMLLSVSTLLIEEEDKLLSVVEELLEKEDELHTVVDRLQSVVDELLEEDELQALANRLKVPS